MCEQSRPGIIMAITSSNKAVITIGMKAHSIVDLPQRKGLYGGFFATIEDAMPGVETRLRDARRLSFFLYRDSFGCSSMGRVIMSLANYIVDLLVR